MPVELVFKLAFVALFAGAVSVRVHYQRLAGTYREGVGRHAETHLAHEARPLLIIRPLLGIPWYAVVVLWFFAPQWIAWCQMPLPLWLRLGGIAMGVAGLMLLWRSHYALGRNFRPTLEVFSEQQLVRTGPYGMVRHPMYIAFLIMLASTGLISANWFIGIVGVLLVASITLVRIPREEALLRDRFGAAYTSYIQTTPAVAPIQVFRGDRRSIQD
ncbi:MAG: isoprenylcysteine carboxylmethyltransferase family protein [Acidobacteriia bacterium]|nr:isoprenylcysteine carboxylmethyltransferase family protein [Terriglobia bacterium]